MSHFITDDELNTDVTSQSLYDAYVLWFQQDQSGTYSPAVNHQLGDARIAWGAAHPEYLTLHGRTQAIARIRDRAYHYVLQNAPTTIRVREEQ